MSCSPSTLLSDGKAFQSLSEREQLITIAQLACDITQSGGAFAVVLANGSAYGPNGVIDTSTTTTNGIQEAISALPAGDLTSRYAGGGFILLGKGVFTCSGQIVIPNAGAFNLRVEGAGKVATILKYTGTASSFIKTSVDTVVGPPGASSLNCTFRSIGLSHSLDTNATIMLRLYALNEVDIDDCLFCPDAALASGGNCLNYTPGGVGHTVKTVGLETYGCNMARIRNSAFWICARGATILSAHGRLDNTVFDGCADSNSGYVFSTDGTFYYPKSYGVMGGGGDVILRGCHFDGCTSPAYCDTGVLQNLEPVFESCTYTSMVGSVNSGLLRLYNPNPAMDSGFTAVDKTINGSGVVAASTDGSIVNFVTSLFTGNLMDIIVGGATIFSVGTQGLIHRSLTKAARNALSSPATGLSVYQTDNTPGVRVYNGTHWVRYSEANDD